MDTGATTTPGWYTGAVQIPAATDRKSARRILLEHMPKQGRCIEVGVNLGLFSREIADITEPKYLGLIDPWEYMTDPVYSSSHFGGTSEVRTALMPPAAIAAKSDPTVSGFGKLAPSSSRNGP